MHVEERIDIDADPGVVWPVMSDVAKWPEWTASVTSVEPLQPGPLALGSEARITQPKFGTRVWRVTSITPGTSFTWETRGPGTLMVGTHTVTPRPGGSTVTLSVDSTGWAVTLFGWLLAGTGRRFVAMEAQGLKRRAEGR